MSIKCKKNVYGFGALAIYRQQDHFEHPHQSPKVIWHCLRARHGT
ncbi:hypothetical protein [Actinoallomurus purpureus]|nr:hypothetical protein [Actinoallomurus purpureus]